MVYLELEHASELPAGPDSVGVWAVAQKLVYVTSSRQVLLVLGTTLWEPPPEHPLHILLPNRWACQSFTETSQLPRDPKLTCLLVDNVPHSFTDAFSSRHSQTCATGGGEGEEDKHTFLFVYFFFTQVISLTFYLFIYFYCLFPSPFSPLIPPKHLSSIELFLNHHSICLFHLQTFKIFHSDNLHFLPIHSFCRLLTYPHLPLPVCKDCL